MVPTALRSGFARARRTSRSGERERGIAILSVITVLVALLLIAVPFVISMKLARERTESNVARAQARFEAELVSRAVWSFLHQTHPQQEQQRYAAGQRGVEADDRVDSLAEITPGIEYKDVIAREMQAGGVPGANPSDARGSIWSWTVTDVNALVNPNGASPYLLGNLLGSATLAQELDPAATSIMVENVGPSWAPGGSPFRRDGGFLRVGGETVRYTAF